MNILALFKPITTFVFDLDGVLTDGNLLITHEGHWLRSMSTRDGFALQLAIKKGYNILVITGSESNAVAARLKKLGINDFHQNIKDKAAVLQEYIDEKALIPPEILFMGDDVPDYSAMKLCGLPSCPMDAVSDIKQISIYISPFGGGKGCVRDVIEKVLKLNNHWELETSVPST
ncbi:MAG: 3-deoxy-D-manno-octulosonate 8-phosphate phosphatase [Chitinophagaceae bacterium]